MYYVSIDKNDSNKLSYYCRNCGDIDDAATNQEIQCVLNTNLKQEEQKYQHIINKYIKLDPTIPRIQTIPCPNENCGSNKPEDDAAHQPREVIYVRYDSKNLKYAYMCCVCNQSW
jgi:hypothetical protein